ncbi:MAG: VOC family protein [Ardenticatenaceae bacterium]|nr:VOC family protein [Ardenticatenaceae bacterium]
MSAQPAAVPTMTAVPRRLLLCVEEFETCFQFYRNALELPLSDSQNGRACFQAGRLALELLEGGKGTTELVKPWGPGGNAFLAALHVNDLDAAVAALTTAGVYFVGRSETAPWGRFVSFADPDGNRWQLVAVPGWAGRPGNRPAGPRFVALRCADLTAQAGFYPRAFGWPIVGRDARSVLFDAAGLAFELVAGGSGQPSPGEAFTLSLEVRSATAEPPDLSAWREHLLAAGGTLIEAAAGRLLVADPEGHAWQIILSS